MKNRRTFLKQASVLSASALALGTVTEVFATQAAPAADGPLTILFQGDSITDGNRSRNQDWNHVLGHGYAYLIAARLWFDFPKKDLMFLNRGISGNTVPDLLNRWDTDAIAIKPDLLSILIGINDTVIEIGGNTSFSTAIYEQNYRKLLQQTQTALPQVKLVLCEPFILPVGKVKDQWDAYTHTLTPKQQIVKALANEFNAIFVPLQEPLNEAIKKAPASHWIWDGVHPMPGGHELIAREWIKHLHQTTGLI